MAMLQMVFAVHEAEGKFIFSDDSHFLGCYQSLFYFSCFLFIFGLFLTLLIKVAVADRDFNSFLLILFNWIKSNKNVLRFILT